MLRMCKAIMEVCRWRFQLPWRWLSVCLALVAQGCQTHPSTELMERDLRLQEDHIYQLQDCLAEERAMLESCRRENASLRAELSGSERQSGVDPSRPQELRPRRIERRPPPALIAPPDIDLGQPVGPDEIPLGEPDLAEPPNGALPLPNSEPSASLEDREPFRLTINRWLTGGLDTNGRPGDDGLMVVLEPRDSAGQPVRLDGAVTLAVFEEGDGDRLARWSFTADEASASWKRSLFGHGYHFELPWPAGPPGRGTLELHAELLRIHGPSLHANHRFAVELPSSGRADQATPGRRIRWRPDR